ncbi:MAG TPA: adenylate/guanylate cyclase domain-containing protein [Gaiellaceae bacterium]|nr:adenylate/guanylate cyclase domain-containing protein [Gaiellaceae bacterium]
MGRFRDRWLTSLAGIGADPHDDADTRADKALLVFISVLILPVALLWAAFYLAFGSPVGWVPLGYFAVLLTSIVVFARTRNFATFLLVGQLAIVLAPTLSMIPLGGFLGSGGVGLWGILAPLAALVFSDVRSAVRWYIAYIVVFLGSGIAGELWGGVSPAVPRWFTTTMLGLNVTVCGTIVFTLLAVFARQRRDALSALREEQAKAENLLLNILPRSIADRLKAETRTIADHVNSASILFADVVDFTPLAERLPPAEVVGVLDHLFSHFDGLAEHYGVEKIKTIGDCYMVAAGVPAPRSDHAHALARMALDMQAAMRSVDEVGHLGLELRIGINSGPVVAGVIGRKRFLYDLWGDAVNTASRMESHGTSGRIQITRATKELLEDEFVCDPRGIISLKGKGETEAWYLVGRRMEHAAEPAETVVTSTAPASERHSE